MMKHQEERFDWRTVGEECQPKVGDDIRCITGIHLGSVAIIEHWILVTSLAGQDFPMIEAGRIRSKCHLPMMPV